MIEIDIQKRKVVWQALSDLYLDTELSEAHLVKIFQKLKSSNFSLKELESINLNDVAPILARNLQGVAGEWQSFEEEWLVKKITERLKRPNWLRMIENKLFRSYRKNLTTEYWKQVVAGW